MGLIVAGLRLFMALLNFYDTFKILKPPPISARTGKVSVRAASQRKRDMKGCVAVWIVWSCFVLYENWADSIVRIFVPLWYDEIKSVLILGLIFSRARGAEPIYLHVIRPLVKPYVVTLDALLDIFHGVGDLLLLVLSAPIRLVTNWWYGPKARHHDRETERDVRESRPYPATRSSSGQSRPPSAVRMPAGNADVTPLGARENTTLSQHGGLQARSRYPAGPREAQQAPSGPQRAPPAYEVWHPPPPAYEDNSGAPAFPQPMIPGQSSRPSSAAFRTDPVDEWRQYPPFPSAYPISPPPGPQKTLSSPPPAISSMFSTASEDPIPYRTGQRHDRSPAAWVPEVQPRAVATPEWDFERSPSQPELTNPGSDFDWSDDRMEGVQQEITSNEMKMDGVSSDEEVEDDFDITLRTPTPKRPRILVDRLANSRPVSVAIDSRATSLTTAASQRSPMETSEGEYSPIVRDERSPVRLGTKRPLPDSARTTTTTNTRRIAKQLNTRSQATIRATERPRRRTVLADRNTVSSDTRDTETSDDQGDEASTDAEPKRRKVMAPGAQPQRTAMARTTRTRGAAARTRAPPPALAHKTSSSNSGSSASAARGGRRARGPSKGVVPETTAGRSDGSSGRTGLRTRARAGMKA